MSSPYSFPLRSALKKGTTPPGQSPQSQSAVSPAALPASIYPHPVSPLTPHSRHPSLSPAIGSLSPSANLYQPVTPVLSSAGSPYIGSVRSRSGSRPPSVQFANSPAVFGLSATPGSSGSSEESIALAASAAATASQSNNARLAGGVPIGNSTSPNFPNGHFQLPSARSRTHSRGSTIPQIPPTPLLSTVTTPSTGPITSSPLPPSLSSYNRPFGTSPTMQYSYGPPPPPPPPHPHPNPNAHLNMQQTSPRIPLAPMGQQQYPPHQRSPSVGHPPQHGYGPPSGNQPQPPYRVAAPSGRGRPEDNPPPTGPIGGGGRRYSIDHKPPSPYAPPLPARPPQPPAQNNMGHGLLPSQAHARTQSADITGGMRRLSVGRYPASPHPGTVAPPGSAGYPPPSPRVGNYGVPPSPRIGNNAYPPSPRVGHVAYPPSPHVGNIPTAAPSGNIHSHSPHGATLHSPRMGVVPTSHMALARPSGHDYGYPTAAAAPPPVDYHAYPDNHLYPDQGTYGRPRSHSAAATQGYPSQPIPSALVRHQQPMPASRPPSPPPKRVIVISAAIENCATDIAQQLARTNPDWAILMKRLPGLTDDQINELRAAYRKVSVVQGQGSLPKHIKSKIPGPLGRAFYATTLGRHEAELYWLSVWGLSQPSGGVRADSEIRSSEFVVECLLGRSPDDLDVIQDSYVDRRFDASLLGFLLSHFKSAQQYQTYQNPQQYAHTRLPFPDSALAAALSISLTAERQDDSDVWPEREVTTDRDALRRALAEKDHHTLLRVILTRSDSHLRLVLRSYEHIMSRNFARDALDAAEGQMLKEILAHVLNGAMNRPARESLLLYNGILAVRRAVARSRSASRQRSAREAQGTQVSRAPIDILTSRVIRLHWDRPLLAKVKAEYKRSYEKSVESDLRDAMGGELGDYLRRLLAASDHDDGAMELKVTKGGLSPSMGNGGQTRGRRGSFF